MTSDNNDEDNAVMESFGLLSRVNNMVHDRWIYVTVYIEVKVLL